MVRSKMLTFLLIPLLALSVPLLPPTQGMADQEGAVSEDSQQQELEFQKLHRQSSDPEAASKKSRRGRIVQPGSAQGYLSLADDGEARTFLELHLQRPEQDDTAPESTQR